jgi:hypothetical protein
MVTKKTIFISAQPDHPYFHWQVEVQLHNFIKLGINPNWIEVLWAHDNSPSYEALALAAKYPTVRFFFYKKTITQNHGYIPILRPDILEQHFRRYPALRGETVFYHDSDIIFRELPDFDSMHGDLYWYLSDTVSYIGAEYIKSKSHDLFNKLCDIAKIDPALVESNQANSGGAQYLMKGVTADFWKEVAEDSLALYKYMADREIEERTTVTDKNYNPIQKWCADMWAVLWGAWKLGAQTKTTSELDFSWGTSGLKDYERCKIMHNAGVTDERKQELFYKGDFRSVSPFDSDLSYVNPQTASAKYVDAILYAKERRIV